MIKNQPPSLEAYEVSYAQAYLGNVSREDDAQDPFTCLAEFIEWPDEPENWTGAWAETHVLALISDHSLTPLRTLKETEAGNEAYAKYTLYNVPNSFRQLIPDTCHVGDALCSRGRITHQEYQSLWAEMEELDRELWQTAQEELLLRMQEDVKGYPTVELPVRILLAGTDDTTYSLCVATRKEAFEILEGLKNCPTWALLKDYGFIFTN